MKVTIKDESELPAPPAERANPMWSHVRSGGDPRALHHGWESLCYYREDGAPWKHPGYRVERHGDGSKTVFPASLREGWGDPGEKEAKDYWRGK